MIFVGGQLLLRGVSEVYPTQLMEAKVHFFQATKVHLGSEYMCVFRTFGKPYGIFCGRKRPKPFLS